MPDLEERCSELLERGVALSQQIGQHQAGGREYWFSEEDAPGLHAWIASVANLVHLTATPNSYFAQECSRVVNDPELTRGVPYHAAQKLVGLLTSLLEEMRHGLLRKAEYLFVASTFDDFIDHAQTYHKANKKVEAAVLVSAVFEDSIRKVATKFGVTLTSVEDIINALAKDGHITPVKAKRYKGCASLRTSALHARWDEFDIKDVGAAIKGTREIIDELL